MEDGEILGTGGRITMQRRRKENEWWREKLVFFNDLERDSSHANVLIVTRTQCVTNRHAPEEPTNVHPDDTNGQIECVELQNKTQVSSLVA